MAKLKSFERLDRLKELIRQYNRKIDEWNNGNQSRELMEDEEYLEKEIMGLIPQLEGVIAEWKTHIGINIKKREEWKNEQP